MQILEQKKAVVLRLRDPARVTTVIPTAVVAKHKGIDVVAVPHRPDETRVLRNLGFDVPDPMPLYYQWPGRYTPFQAQRATATFASMHHRCFILNSMGTGKTLSVLWAYDYLRRTKAVKRALVVCPLSTMERTWADEAFRSLPHLDTAVLYGTRERRQKLLARPADLYIINTDGLRTIEDELAERDDIDLIILDESALFRNASTERWRSANKICNKQLPRRVWALTGSPTPNSPTDAWAQCRLVVPDHPDVPKYFTKFRDQVMRQITQFKWVPREDAMETVRKIMQPAIRFALEDCVDLPEQVVITHDVELSKEQRHAYADMMRTLMAEYGEGQILAVNEAVKANKLIQIACGVAYGVSGDTVTLPAKPRIDVLKEVIEESEGKCIVFVPLTGVLEHLKAELEKETTVAVVHGATPKHERDQIFEEFQNRPTPHVLLANPGTMSHGLTLTAATTVVWFAPIYSGEQYEQACARVRRPGQTRTTVIVHLAATDLERRVYDRLKNKQALQGALLDMIKEATHEALVPDRG